MLMHVMMAILIMEMDAHQHVPLRPTSLATLKVVLLHRSAIIKEIPQSLSIEYTKISLAIGQFSISKCLLGSVLWYN